MQYMKQKIYNSIQDVKKLIDEQKIDPYEGYAYLSLLVAQNSNDTSTKTGACIVNSSFEVLSYGFNALPEKFQGDVDWKMRLLPDNSNWLSTKYPKIFHAERQAIFSAFKQKQNLKDAMMFASLFPCNECALSIIESEISHLYYYDDKYHDAKFSVAARELFDGCQVPYEQVVIKEPYLVKKIKQLGEL